MSASPSPPYNIGQDVQLSCSVYPRPAVPEYISWSIGNNQIVYQTYGQQAGNWTWTVNTDGYQSENWYCTVYINDFIVAGAMEVMLNGEIDVTSFNTYENF